MYWFIVSNFRLCLKYLFKYSDSSGICGLPKLLLKFSQSGRLPVTSFLAVPLILYQFRATHRYLFPYATDCSHCSACSSYSWYEAASPDHCGTPSLLLLISTILTSFPRGFHTSGSTSLLTSLSQGSATIQVLRWWSCSSWLHSKKKFTKPSSSQPNGYGYAISHPGCYNLEGSFWTTDSVDAHLMREHQTEVLKHFHIIYDMMYIYIYVYIYIYAYICMIWFDMIWYDTKHKVIYVIYCESGCMTFCLPGWSFTICGCIRDPLCPRALDARCRAFGWKSNELVSLLGYRCFRCWCSWSFG